MDITWLLSTQPGPATSSAAPLSSRSFAVTVLPTFCASPTRPPQSAARDLVRSTGCRRSQKFRLWALGCRLWLEPRAESLFLEHQEAQWRHDERQRLLEAVCWNGFAGHPSAVAHVGSAVPPRVAVEKLPVPARFGDAHAVGRPRHRG